MHKTKYITSILAGLISTAVVGYSLLAPIWGFQLVDKVTATGSIIVMILSMLLSVFTGQKISKEYTTGGLVENIFDEPVEKGKHSL